MKKKDESQIRPSQQVYNKKLRDLEMPIITKNEKFLLFCGFLSESRENWIKFMRLSPQDLTINHSIN